MPRKRPDKRKRFKREKNLTLAIDTETTGLDFHQGCRLFAISTCDEEGRTNYWEWPVDPRTRQPKIDSDELKEVKLEVGNYRTLVFHNAKFDVQALSLAGLDLTDRWEDIHDTLIASHILDSYESHGLKDLGVRYLSISDEDEEALKQQVRKARRKAIGLHPDWKLGKTVAYDYWLPSLIFPDQAGRCQEYCVKDSIRTVELWKLFRYALEAEDLQDIYERERKLIQVVYRTESRGITVDPERYLSKKVSEETRAINHDKTLKRLAKNPELNPRSGKQLIKILYSDMSLPVIKRTEKKHPSTDVETVETLLETATGNAKRFLETLSQYKTSQTTLGYLENYRKASVQSGSRWVLYPSFNQTGTRTTRFSSNNPNGQNIGKDSKVSLREIFSPIPGDNWYCFDYDQLELRIAAVASGDKNLYGAFASGKDVHQYTADLCNAELRKQKLPAIISRQAAKTVNYAVTYGAGEEKLERMTGVEGIKQLYFQAYPGLGNLMRALNQEGRRNGLIKTQFGYPLRVSKEKSYAALNYHIQGWAGDILKNAMIDIDHRMPKVRMIMTIHDELVFAISGKTAKHNLLQTLGAIRDAMVKAGEELDVYTPVSCSKVSTNWSEKEPMDLDKLVGSYESKVV